MPPPAVWPNWLPAWNHPAARPRVAGVVLCAISPSVANALKVAATIVNSVSTESSGAVDRVSGTAVIASRPTEIDAIEIRYHGLARERVVADRRPQELPPAADERHADDRRDGRHVEAGAAAEVSERHGRKAVGQPEREVEDEPDEGVRDDGTGRHAGVGVGHGPCIVVREPLPDYNARP